MIKATFSATSFEIKGHANFADAGQDIVCAAASAIAISMVQAMSRFVAEDMVTIKESDGYLLFQVHQTNETIQILLKSMKDTLTELKDSYPKAIQIKENDND
jgi:uncharacterized protein